MQWSNVYEILREKKSMPKNVIPHREKEEDILKMQGLRMYAIHVYCL